MAKFNIANLLVKPLPGKVPAAPIPQRKPEAPQQRAMGHYGVPVAVAGRGCIINEVTPFDRFQRGLDLGETKLYEKVEESATLSSASPSLNLTVGTEGTASEDNTSAKGYAAVVKVTIQSDPDDPMTTKGELSLTFNSERAVDRVNDDETPIVVNFDCTERYSEFYVAFGTLMSGLPGFRPASAYLLTDGRADTTVVAQEGTAAVRIAQKDVAAAFSNMSASAGSAGKVVLTAIAPGTDAWEDYIRAVQRAA